MGYVRLLAILCLACGVAEAASPKYYEKTAVPPPGITFPLSGFFYKSDGASILNVADRLMVGSAAQANGQGPSPGYSPAYSGYPSWLAQNNYLFRDTQLGAISSYGLWGITAATRASDYTGGLSQALGAYGGLVVNDSGTRVGRALYMETDLTNSAANISNLIGEFAGYDTSGNDYTVTPYGGSGFGTAFLRFGCGESALTTPATTNCNYGLYFVGKLNGSSVTFNKGIVFARDSLTGTTGASGGGNAAQAIEMGYGQGIRWWSANGSFSGGRISSLATAGSDQSMEMDFLNNGVQWANNSSTNTLKITHTASGQNGVLITDAVNGSGPTIKPISGDSETDLPLNLAGLGTGGVASADPVTLTGALTVSTIVWPNVITGAGVFNGALGIKIPNSVSNITDTTSSGTIASTYSYRFGGDTFKASSATTLTNVYTMNIEPPIAGLNVTITNPGNSLRLGGGLLTLGLGSFNAGATILGAATTINHSSNFDTSINDGTSTGTVNIGNGSGNNTIGIGNGSGVVTLSGHIVTGSAADKGLNTINSATGLYDVGLRVGRVICSAAVASAVAGGGSIAAAHTGDTNEFNIAVCTIPANTVTAGSLLRVDVLFYRNAVTTNTVGETVRDSASSGAISGGTAYTGNDATSGGVAFLRTFYIWHPATNVQMTAVLGGNAVVGSLASAPTAGAIDRTATSYLNFNCKDTTSAADTCGVYGYTVTLYSQ